MVSRSSILAFLTVALVAVPRHASALQAQDPPAAPCPATDSTGNTAKGSSADDSTPKKKRDKSTSAQPCTPAAKEPSTSQRFPFPGESPAPPLPGSSSSVPDAPTQSGRSPSAAEEHPFPGSAPPMLGSESGSSSSSDSSDGSSANPSDSAAPGATSPPLDDKGDNPRAAVRRRLPKVQKLQNDEDRAAEDLNVAKFYEQSGDLNAAYLRARDAVKYQPSDPEAHFALAHLAQKLNKRDEAVTEYNAYLQLAPDGTQIKQAHNAIDQLKH